MRARPERPALARPEMCPSCERFIGPVDACPYCGADAVRAPVMRFLRWGALALAAAGLLFLYLFARGRQPPEVRVGEITPLMNFAAVSVSGSVPRDAYVGRRRDAPPYLSFAVEDGTGALRVAAYGEAAAGLIAAGRVPRRGDRVRVSGALDVSADEAPRLRLAVAAGLVIADAEAEARSEAE